MEETVFHKIVSKEIPAEIVFEDEQCLVIRDINPVAPVHLLVLPKLYIRDLSKVEVSHAELLGHLLVVAAEVACHQGIHESGYRTVINCGSDGGMEIPYLHVHVIGGKKLPHLG